MQNALHAMARRWAVLAIQQRARELASQADRVSASSQLAVICKFM